MDWDQADADGRSGGAGGAGAREPNHTHPNDLLTVQIESGIVGILNGTDLSTANREPGFMQFLPRGVVHAFGSVNTRSFEILSVAIK